LFGPTQVIGGLKKSVSDKISSTEFRGSVDTFGITQKLGSIAAETLDRDNMNNKVNEIIGSDESSLDDKELESSSEDEFTANLKTKLIKSKMAFEPT
jgi:hypothetical protein